MAAEYLRLEAPQICADCGAELLKGENVKRYKTSKGTFIYYCKGEHKNPPKAPENLKVPEPSQAIKVVEERLNQAIALVDKTLPDAKNWSDYNDIVAETLANLRSEAWIAWEREKIKKGIMR